METKSKIVSEKHQKSANFAFEQKYSAHELGDLMNKSPLALLDLDMGYQTNWYDCDFIEEAMSFIREEADMLMFMTLVVNNWREQTIQLHSRVAYRDPKTKESVPYVKDLELKLDEIHDRLLSDREQIKKVCAFREMFFKNYSNSRDVNHKQSIPTPNIDSQKHMSSVRQLNVNAAGQTFTIPLESLPEDIRSIILLNQSSFNVFVKQLNEDTWSIVDSNRGLYCDALRFVCIKREIIARNTDRETFDRLLHLIVKALENQPSLLSSLKRRTDTSTNKISRSLKCYDSPIKSHQNEVWQLIKDCEPIETSLQPVYEAMETAAISTLKNMGSKE